jgi:hypothetical protein
MGDSFRAAAGRSQWPAAEATGRLYGSETAVFDQTWKPDDLVKAK